MGDELVAVCLLCHTRIKDDQKLFETHYETHHRRPQTSSGELSNSCEGEQWEFILSEDLPTKSTVVQSGQTETQNCRQSEPNRDAIELDLVQTGKLPAEIISHLGSEPNPDVTINQLIKEILSEKLPTNQADVNSDQNEIELKATEDSREATPNQNRSNEADTMWKCSFLGCNKQFASKNGLRQHSHGHSKVFYSCQHCESKFKFPNALCRHLKDKHSPTPFTKYRCGQCQQLFFTKVKLTQHRFSHSQKPKFTCGDCGLIFSSNCILQYHNARKHKKSE